jgi:hypothetical protein
MTKLEVSKHAAELVRREAAGDIVGKKRKERSDKGIRKGPKARPGVPDGVESDDNSSDAENHNQVAGPSKKRKTTENNNQVAGPSKKRKTKTKPKQTSTQTAASKGKGKAKVSSQLPSSREILSDTDESELDNDTDG